MISIQQFIQTFRANSSNYAIPEFQRSFTWKNEQIEAFFDSIIRQYPIPRFFIWQSGVGNTVGLYYFAQNFTTRPVQGEQFIDDDYSNQLTNIICDGQQRLTSLVIGFKGLNSSSTRVSKFLYFNLFSNFDEISSQKFKFLSIAEAQVETNEQFFIKVSELYELYIHRAPGTGVIPFVNSVITQYNVNQFETQLVNSARANIEKFVYAITNMNYLDLQDITNSIDNDLSQAVEFFMRINEGGTPLTQNQILFSLISRYLQLPQFHHINLRADFNDISDNDSYRGILKNKNKTYDFFLRCSLYVSTDSVLFKATRFDLNNCTLMLNDWPNLFISISKTLDLVVELKLDKMILSLNSLIPIINHFFKNGNVDVNANEKNEILKYILRAQFSKIFGSHGDSLLSALKTNQENLYIEGHYSFLFSDLNCNLPTNKSFNLSSDEIQELLELKYGNIKTRAILNLVYSNLLGGVISYDIDHIHPQSICKVERKLLLNNAPVGDISMIKQNYDKLPNLQLLQSGCNLNKSDIPISDWISTVLNNFANQMGDLACLNGKISHLEYIRDNKINIPTQYNSDQNIHQFISIENFRAFYNVRRNYLFQLLWDKLGDGSPTPPINQI